MLLPPCLAALIRNPRLSAHRSEAALSTNPFIFLPTAILSANVLVFIIRCVIVFGGNWFPSLNYFPLIHVTHTRLDSLLFGVLLGYVFYMQREKWTAWGERLCGLRLPVGIAIFVLPLFIPKATVFMQTIGFTILYVGAGLILWAAVDREPRQTRLVRALAFVGSRSYSIYLWHFPIEAGVRYLHEMPNPLIASWHVYVLLYLALSLGVGIVMAHLVELPILNLRDRWFPSRSGTVATS